MNRTCTPPAAAARPSATQSGMPIERKPLPATKMPRRTARRCSISRRARSGRRCAGRRRAPARDTRQHRSLVDAKNRLQVRRARSTSSSSVKSTAPGSCEPPTNARSSAMPAGARPLHFDDTHVHAVMRGPPARREPRRSRIRSADEQSRLAARPARRSRSTRTEPRDTDPPSGHRSAPGDRRRRARAGKEHGAGRQALAADGEPPPVRVAADSCRPVRFATERVRGELVARSRRPVSSIPSSERSEQTIARRGRCGSKRADDTAVPSFGFDKPGKQRMNRQRLDVARVNPAEKRLGNRARPSRIRTAGGKMSRPIRQPRSPAGERLARARDASCAIGDSKSYRVQPAPRCRDSEHRRGGQRVAAGHLSE